MFIRTKVSCLLNCYSSFEIKSQKMLKFNSPINLLKSQATTKEKFSETLSDKKWYSLSTFVYLTFLNVEHKKKLKQNWEFLTSLKAIGRTLLFPQIKNLARMKHLLLIIIYDFILSRCERSVNHPFYVIFNNMNQLNVFFAAFSKIKIRNFCMIIGLAHQYKIHFRIPKLIDHIFQFNDDIRCVFK